MNTELMEYVHQSIYDLLCEFDRVCKKFEIPYFINAGALLGAIRHQDFIPWDDDLDILLYRKDYERLLDVFEKEADQRFKVYDYHEYTEFFDICTRIADLDLVAPTTHGKKWDDFYEGRICHTTIDLQVLDYVGKFHKLRLFLLKAIHALAMGHRPEIEYGKFHGLLKLGAYILPAVGRHIQLTKLTRAFDFVAQVGGKVSNCIYCSNAGPEEPRFWGAVFDARDFQANRKAKIRDRMFSVPDGYDSVLRRLYGDYMQLPPERERVPKHLIISEVNKN